MTVKIKDLAKELEMDSKELLEKVKSMGMDADSESSTLSDINTMAVRNTVLRSRAGAETKIVRVAPKKTEKEPVMEEPRVVVKAATIKPVTTGGGAVNMPKEPEKVFTQKPPMGRPVISKDLDARTKAQAVVRPPIGTPVVAFEEAGKAPETSKQNSPKKEEIQEAEVLKVEAVKKDVAKPITPKSESIKAETSKKEAAKAETVKTEEAKVETSKPEAPKPEETVHIEAVSKLKIVEYAKRSTPEEIAQSEKAQIERSRAAADRPRSDRPQGDRPPRPSGDRPYGDRPQGDRTPRPSGDRPYGDRPQGDRPPRPSGDRPYGDRPPRPSGDRPYGDRPPRPTGDRPYGDRAPRPAGDKSDKPPITSVGKPIQKHVDEKGKKEKERDKFAKLEGGKKPKTAVVAKSLEKQVKPKRQNRGRPVVVEEEAINMEALPEGTKVVNVPITVAGFCEQLGITTSTIIMKLMKLGIMANINQNIDEDTVLILAAELGLSVVVGKVSQDAVEEGLELFEDKEEDLKDRPPIITVMGHVDHGKTSLLDAIRKTNVIASESGGITQHIGASEVTINGQKIVFLDTPGHEAFTAMRARGAHVTDIAVLLVAADDSVKPQTIESISHAKAAGVPIIVAINKIDKPAANPDKVKQDLTEHGILVEEWGGDTICVPVSAKTGEGIVNLLEMILLQAEVLELKANPNRLASGTVIEARLDKAKGPVATLLVLNGTLQSGTSIVAGTCAGKIRLMTNHKGDTIRKAGPATAVEILGLTEVPEAGDEFNAVREDRQAREIAENRKSKLREEVMARNSSSTLEALFSQIQEGEVKELNLIIKGDVQGSVGAVVSSLEKLKNENVRVKIIHTGVGTVTESDIMLAGTSGAIIIGFNVRPNMAVSAIAERENVEIRTYRVIYHIIEEIEAIMKGMLDPIYKESILGQLEIRNTFKVPNIGIIGGAYVTNGKIPRNAEVRVIRDGIVVHEGKISSLKRFKDDVKEVAHGFECGIGIERYNDLKEGDVIECFKMEEVERK